MTIFWLQSACTQVLVDGVVPFVVCLKQIFQEKTRNDSRCIESKTIETLLT